MIATPSGSRDRPDRALCEAYAAARMGPLRRVVFWAGTGGTAYRIDSRWQRTGRGPNSIRAATAV